MSPDNRYLNSFGSAVFMTSFHLPLKALVDCRLHPRGCPCGLSNSVGRLWDRGGPNHSAPFDKALQWGILNG